MGIRSIAQRTNSIAVLVLLLVSRGAAAKDPSIDNATWRALITSNRNVIRTIDDLNSMVGRTPVYYVSRFGPDPLTKQERQDIYEQARRVDRWRDIWFIVVHWHRKGIYEAIVYFKPDFEDGKVRQGVAVRVDPILFLGDPSDPYLLGRNLGDYVQYGEEPPEKFQPRPQNLPIPGPVEVSNKELAELIVSIYSEPKPAKRRPNALQRQPEVVRVRDRSGSILSVRRKGDAVEVKIGIREGGLSGIGRTLHCKKEDGEWVITEGGMWVN